MRKELCLRNAVAINESISGRVIYTMCYFNASCLSAITSSIGLQVCRTRILKMFPLRMHFARLGRKLLTTVALTG